MSTELWQSRHALAKGVKGTVMKPSGYRFCFTLDTEPDDLWSDRRPLTFEHCKRLPEFHRQLLEAGARPTYLTTSEVVEAKVGRQALEAILQEGACEIGAHFHAWTRDWPFEIPDLRLPDGGRLHAMAHHLGQVTEERMLAFTCRALREALGVEPRSYRGGKWSLGPDTPRSLAHCGISVDSTVTPGLSWGDASHPWLDGPDFSDISCQPFRLTEQILELPVGGAVWPQGAARFFKHPVARGLAGALGKLIGLPLGYRWLRPTTMSGADMRAVMTRLKELGCSVWVFMIHSSEIIPCGHHPSQERVTRFIGRCLEAVRSARALGALPATLREAAQFVEATGPVGGMSGENPVVRPI
jgi:hypothetical protein